MNKYDFLRFDIHGMKLMSITQPRRKVPDMTCRLLRQHQFSIRFVH